jgi:Ca2+-transporting ATPase
VDPETPLAERSSMLHKGTSVSRGSGVGVVVSTGMDTELGRVSALVEEAEDEATPLERRLAALGRRLVWVTLALAALVAGSGLLSGRPPLLIVETAIALAVAAIPEGLPIVATLALARGMWRMARRNALVERLSAVETLGSTTVVLTDKTGTLTENRMRVTRIALPGADVELAGEGGARAFTAGGEPVDPPALPPLDDLLRVAVLCNASSLGDPAEGGAPSGDPTETALLAAARAAGLERDALLERWPEEEREAFDPAKKMMATVHGTDGGRLVAVKGAPEAVVEASSRVRRQEGDAELSDGERRRWIERARAMAEDGLRVLAVAERRSPGEPGDVFRDLTLLGLTGLLDPPRRDVRASVEACRVAGIRVVMVTGDHPATARNVAAAVGIAGPDDEVLEGRELDREAPAGDARRRRLLDAHVYARTSPEQKLMLLDLHQEEGDVAAMIGDGVNDAPALKKADIGVAMGRRGTQVAREAADMVLQDDRFGTVVAAVEQGRAIFDNIRKFVVYLLSCNVSELMVVTLATLAGAPLPLLPLQILFLNLVTDVFPALALGGLEGAEGLMRRPPRDPDEPVLTRGHWWAVAGHGAVLTAAVLAGLALALGRPGAETGDAVTISFLVLAFGQLWHVFNMAGPTSGVLRNEVTRNGIVWGAVLLCVGLILAAVHVPIVADVLSVEPPDRGGWALVAGLSVAPLAVGRAVAVGRRLVGRGRAGTGGGDRGGAERPR